MTKPTEPRAPALPATDAIIAPARFRPPASGLRRAVPRLPWPRMLGVLLLALILTAAWYVLTARSVGIRVVPAEATVDVREWPALGLGGYWLLHPGPRRVLVAAPETWENAECPRPFARAARDASSSRAAS